MRRRVEFVIRPLLALMATPNTFTHLELQIRLLFGVPVHSHNLGGTLGPVHIAMRSDAEQQRHNMPSV
jgi:hypothetical protein